MLLRVVVAMALPESPSIGDFSRLERFNNNFSPARASVDIGVRRQYDKSSRPKPSSTDEDEDQLLNSVLCDWLLYAPRLQVNTATMTMIQHLRSAMHYPVANTELIQVVGIPHAN